MGVRTKHRVTQIVLISLCIFLNALIFCTEVRNERKQHTAYALRHAPLQNDLPFKEQTRHQ